jgi:hypothetical protein
VFAHYEIRMLGRQTVKPVGDKDQYLAVTGFSERWNI